ncbi:MAG: DinB family protein [Gemmataceae bacterium]
MTGRDAIKTALEMTGEQLNWFLGDFTDADMFVRPVPNANHAAWQVGNIIGGDIFFIKTEFPDAQFPEMPAGFLEKHGPEGTKLDGPEGFLTKDEYLKLFTAVRQAVTNTLGKLSDADLDKPSSEKMRKWAPTAGHVFLMCANHTTMHVGQFSVIRRKLGKPVLV